MGLSKDRAERDYRVCWVDWVYRVRSVRMVFGVCSLALGWQNLHYVRTTSEACFQPLRRNPLVPTSERIVRMQQSHKREDYL